jgi:pimeloyl-ACP methyl ester carboxylesterase
MSFLEISWRKQTVTIEYALLGSPNPEMPLLVFLHEGLGSVAMWKDFPLALCQLLGCQGLVYSRPAYGSSTPRPKEVVWKNDFLHQQALEVFPELLRGLNIQEPVNLIGHSDGGSIALLIAAYLPDMINAVAVVAPHIFVEEITIQSIQEAKEQYLQGSLKAVLSKYHQDVDSAFWGWNDVWLSPEFLHFNITSELIKIKSPLIAIQGSDDPYGTMAQVSDIKKYVPFAQIVEIPKCGHAVHKDSPIILSNALQGFFKSTLRNTLIK